MVKNSIKSKWFMLVLFTTFFALTVGFAINIYVIYNKTKDRFKNEINLNSALIEEYCAAPMAFKHYDVAVDALKKLMVIPNIESAFIFNKEGEMVASYPQGKIPKDYTDYTFIPEEVDMFTEDNFLQISQIEFNDRSYGYIFIVASVEQISEEKNNLIYLSLALLFISIAIAAIIANIQQKYVTTPIIKLSKAAKKITERKDYSFRIHKEEESEIGDLYDSFNEMLGVIEESNIELLNTNKELVLSESKYRNYIKDAPESIFVIDNKGVILEANPKATQLLDKSLDEIQNEKIDKFFVRLNNSPINFNEFLANSGDYLEVKIEKEGLTKFFELSLSKMGLDRSIVFVVDVTNKTIAEIKANENRLFLRKVIDLVPHMIYVKDIDGKYVVVNKVTADAYGTTPSEMVNNEKYADLVDEFTRQEDIEVIIHKKKKIISKEIFNDYQNKTRIFRTTKIPFEYYTTEKPCLIGVSIDITNEEKAKERLEKAEEKFRLAVESTTDALFDWNLKKDKVILSPKFYEILGYAKEEIEQKFENLLKIIHPDQKEEFNILFQDYLLKADETEKFSKELKFRTKDNNWKWINFDCKIVKVDEAHEIERIVGTLTDISEKKFAEEQILKSREQYKILAENLNDVIVLLDTGGTIKYISPSAEPLFGYEISFFNERNIKEIVYGDDLENFERQFSHLNSENDSTLIEFRVINKNKLYNWFEASARQINKSGSGENEIIAVIRNIDERREAEKYIRESESKFRGFYEANLVGMVIFDIDRRFLQVNNHICEILGYQRNKLIGLTLDDISVLKDDDEKEKYGELLKGKLDNYESNKNLYSSSGKIKYTFMSIRPYKNISNKIEYLYATIQDLTAKRIAEKNREEMRQRFVLFMDHFPGAVYIKDKDLRLIYINKYMSEFIKDEDWHYKTPEELFPEKEAKNIRRGDEGALKYGIFKLTESFKDKDGNPLYFNTTKFKLDIIDKEVMVGGISIDITDKRALEEKTLQAKERLDMAVEGGDLGLWDYNYKTQEAFYSSRWCSMIGYELEEVETKKQFWENHLHPDDFEKTVQILSDYSEGKIPVYQTEHRLRHKNGHYIWIYSRGRIVERETDGKPIRIVGIHQDITERKRVLEELKISKDRFQSIFNTAPVALFEEDYSGIYKVFREFRKRKIINLKAHLRENKEDLDKLLNEFRIIDLNDAAIKLFEAKSKEDYLENMFKVFTDKSDEVFFNEMQTLYEGKKQAFESEDEYLTLKGNPIKTLLKVHLPRKKSEYDSVLVSIVDLTEVKKYENERIKLLQEIKQKNKELEQILFVASHDLRTPLVNIQGFSRELERDFSVIDEMIKSNRESVFIDDYKNFLKEDIFDSLNFITSSTSKMDILLKGLLKLSRLGRAALEIHEINMNAMFEQIISSMSFQIKEAEAELQINDLHNCYADETQINQLFTNLIDNSIKYRSHNRKCVIRITSTEKEKFIEYKISDTGIGIKTEYLDKIFEIFHRLDPESDVEGEGLGLTIVMRILHRNNGKIRVESEPDKGSTFFIELPKSL